MSEMDKLFSARMIQLAIIDLVALILSICVHEFGHAWVADRLGDRLPRAQGRVTLNPLAHIDPIGTILFPLVAFFLSASGSALGSRVLGWGKPVQISLHARWMTRGMRIKTAHMIIALAGPMMNVLFASLLSVLFVVLLRTGFAEYDPVREVPLFAFHIGTVVQMNLGLALFNLLPCPPLDGGAVLAGILPDGSPVINFLNRYGQFIFLALLFTGLLAYVMMPAHLLSDLWIGVLRSWAP